jgi:GT2 family glycosyltransferase/glycosyltransferase involved in cell wall biosynthesis
VELGYKIYYFTHDIIKNDPKYEKNLYDIGVAKVLVVSKDKDIYCDKLYIDTVDSGINFDIAIFYFYDMYENYIKKIKSKTPTIKTIIDSVDVHWLRMERGNIPSNKSLEKKCYSSADVVFAVTENDKEEIIKECPDANVKILSNIHLINEFIPNYNNKNLLFIGGSNHTPNIQAALEAIEIFLKFKENYPQYNNSKLFLVGKYFSQIILNKAKDDSSIQILGHLSDQELDKLYKYDILGSLNPILWGAGIKGKICQAISYNIPVLTTQIGNEGINLQHGIDGFLCESKKDFIDSIYALFNADRDRIVSMTHKAAQKIKLLTSKESAKEVLEGSLLCKKIILSIASYNNRLILERCINSIIQNTAYPNYIIHVTSNGCKDGTDKLLLDLQKIYGSHKIQYTINTENKHFIIAHNDVISKYKDFDVVLINNDMEFKNYDWLNHLYSSAYCSASVGCSGGKTLDYSGNISEMGAYLFNDGTGINVGRGKPALDDFLNRSKYVGYVSGCLMYMKRSMINRFGALDIRFYPCYYEDSDWQYNLHIHGYKTIVSHKCEVFHMEGGSESKANISDFKLKCMENNKAKFLQKYKNINLEDYNH